MNFATPAGFRDVLSEEAQQRELIARAVQDRFASCGYAPIETPTLEAMDVMRASGRLPGSPFKFFDSQGDLLAMRPDVTLQVARMVATRLPGQPGPFRFRYMQRVFREAEGQTRAEPRETRPKWSCKPPRASLRRWASSASACRAPRPMPRWWGFSPRRFPWRACAIAPWRLPRWASCARFLRQAARPLGGRSRCSMHTTPRTSWNSIA